MKFNFDKLSDNYTGLHSKTKEYIEDQDIDYRYDNGQYFTPRELQTKLLKKIPIDNLSDSIKVLDPACGTGEFLYTMNKICNNCKLYGWELDEDLSKITRNIVPNSDIKTLDTLKHKTDEKFDIIIGNPPYYEFKPDDELKEEYDEIMYGRTNIYGLFIYKSLEMLKSGGYLAFVNPPSMNNGAYFKELRNYIVDNCGIVNIEIINDADIFEDASQSTMCLVIEKGADSNDDYIFRKNDITIFSEGYKMLRKEFENKKTLNELGYKVKTGSIIWNRNKNILSNNDSGVKLIYSKNITKDGLKLENHSKPQYLDIDDSNSGPAIVVNRIVGQPGQGEIRAALIPENEKFLAENHVNVVKPDGDLEVSIQHILDELNHNKNVEIVQKITGNSQISKTELEKLFPIDPNENNK